MPEVSEVKHYQVNGRYKVQFERSAVKGQDGFKVEANDDNMDLAQLYAETLYKFAQDKTKPLPENKVGMGIPKEDK